MWNLQTADLGRHSFQHSCGSRPANPLITSCEFRPLPSHHEARYTVLAQRAARSELLLATLIEQLED
jgi:hypothetical protein